MLALPRKLHRDRRLHAHTSVVNSDARGMQEGVQHDTTEIPLFTIIYGAS